MKRKWVRILAWLAGAVALFAALGFFAVPPLARSQLEKLLSAELQRPVSIERISFNPFTLKAAVEGLAVAGREGAQPGLLAFDRLDVDAAWRSVIERAPVIERIKLSGLRLRLVRQAEGRYDVDDLIEKWAAQPSDPDAPTPRFALANIELEGGRVEFVDEVLPRTHEIADLVIRVPFLSSLPVHQQIDVLPELAARVNGAALEIEGRSRPFAETHESAMEFDIAPLDLAAYAGYLPANLPVKLQSAVLSAELQVNFRQPAGQGPMVQVQGRVGLEKLGLRDPAGAPLLSVAAIEARGLDLKPFGNAYEIRTLQIRGARATVHRKAGEPRFFHAVLGALEKRQPGTAASGPAGRNGGSGSSGAAPATGSAARPVVEAPGRLRWAIGELALDDGTIDFLDETFEPRRLAVKAGQLRVRVNGLGSDFSKAVPYELGLVTDTGERISSDGSLRLDPLLVDGKAALEQAALKNWWWIAEPHLQADLRGGTLSAQTALRVAAGEDGPTVKLSGLSAELKALQLAQRWDRRELLRVDSLKLADTELDLQERKLRLGSVESSGGRVAVSRDRRGVLNVTRLVDADAPAAQGARRAAADRPAARTAAGRGASAGTAAARGRAAQASAASASSAGDPGASGASGEPWSVRLDRLQLRGWSGTLTDAAAGSASDLKLSQLNLLAEGFDTERNSRGRLRLQTRVGSAGSLNASGQIGLQPVSARLNIDARRIGVLPAQPYFTEEVNAVVSSGELSARGSLALDLPERGGPRASWKGQAALNDFAAVLKAGGEELLRWKTLQAERIDFVLEPLKVEVGEVALSDFYSRLVISPEGRLNLQDVLVREAQAAQAAQATTTRPQPSAPADSAPTEYGQVAPAQPAEAGGDGTRRAPGRAETTVPDAPSAPLPVRLGRIVLTNGNVLFTDNFIRPNYSANLTDLGGSVGTMTADTAGEVELRGRIDNSGALEILGSINPFSPSLMLDLRAKATGFDLPRTTPYAIKYLGYGIEKGKLSADVKYTLKDRRLQAENRIVLDQLTFGEKVESPTATKLPVLFAVSLLKDRNGVIDVQMPIAGTLDDPQFSVGGLVLRMIFNLIAKAVTAPFSVLAGLAGGGPELSHLAFDPGSAALGGETRKRLETLAKALADRPGLRMDLAGRADPAQDFPALRQRALQDLVKAQKLREMARRGEAAPRPSEVRVSAEEYPTYLRLAWRAGDFKKPRNFIGMIKDVPPDEMERMLLDSVKLDDEALRRLAGERAQAARDWLVEQGIAAERLFVVAPKLGREGVAEGGSATGVDLSLK